MPFPARARRRGAPAPLLSRPLRARGQSFEPFRLLIAVVMALAVLAIIMGVIQYVEAMQKRLALEALRDGMVTARNNVLVRGTDPAKDVFVVRRSVPLPAGRYLPRQFVHEAELPFSCLCFEVLEPLRVLEVDAPGAPGKKMQVFDVPAPRTSDLYFQCFKADEGVGGCAIRCAVGVDTKPVTRC